MKTYMVIATSIALLTGCGSQNSLLAVDSSQYSDQELCWRDGNGEFKSFAVVREFEGGYTIYPVSGYCYISENGRDVTMNHLGEIKIDSDNGLLEGRIVQKSNFFENHITDTMSKSELGRIFFFRGDISRLTIKGIGEVNIFNISKVSNVRDTGLKFEQFKNMSPEDRFSIFSKF